MDKKREEFMIRLRETFRVEATEHLEAITTGLLDMEHSNDQERAGIVERIFREAHSLKGAARSVDIQSVEALCLELESIFAIMKRDGLRVSTENIDIIHSAIRILEMLCGSPGVPLSPEDMKQEQKIHAMLQGIIQGTPDTCFVTADVTDPLQKVIVSKPSAIKTTQEDSLLPDQSQRRAPAVGQDTVRVSTQKISAIMLETEELVGAKIAINGRAAELRFLVADLTQWNLQRSRRVNRQRRDNEGMKVLSEFIESEILYTRSLETALRKLAGAVHQDSLSLATITDRLLEDTKKVLLLPCSYLLSTMPKILRELAREQGKEAELIIIGEDIEIDRRVLDDLKDPLIHMLRNCVDHGIEKPDTRRNLGKPTHGTVTISVKPVEGNRVEFSMIDDGAGIDTDKVRKAAVRLGLLVPGEESDTPEEAIMDLIFQSGLSTSPIITNLSGRGLGLAIVREKVEKLDGTIHMTSNSGKGTTICMCVPLSQTTFRGVFVDVAGQRFVIPTSSVLRVGRVKPEEIKTVENRRIIIMDGHAISLVHLRDVLELTGLKNRDEGAVKPVVLARSGDRRIAFVVDGVLGEQEVMVKSLGRQLGRVRNIAGACISGSGVVIPILNVADIIQSASMMGASGPGDVELIPESDQQQKRLLVAEDSITARTLVKSILEGAGYEVLTSVDGMDALTLLKTESFDLLVSDIDMPRMNGFELTARVRADKKLCELPVVLVTALSSQKDREYGIEVGANAYIVKSDFDQSNLLEIIRRLL